MRSSDLDPDDEARLRALREGDERVFGGRVNRRGHMMLGLALSRVECRAVAEEVVQDAWLTVLRSLDCYEGRSTFRTPPAIDALRAAGLIPRGQSDCAP